MVKFMNTDRLPPEAARAAEAAYRRAVDQGRVVVDVDGHARAFASRERAKLWIDLRGGQILEPEAIK